MSERVVVKFEKKKNSLSAFFYFALFTHRFLKVISFRKMLGLFLMAILVISSIQAFEVELCNNDVPIFTNINLASFEGINVKDKDERGPATANQNPLENHNFCHQNHICQLIFYNENNFNIFFSDNGAQDTFLFPPEDLFLDGPFRPPKANSGIKVESFDGKLIYEKN